MLNALGLARSSGGVQDEQPVLGVHLFCLTLIGLLGHQIMPVDISARLHGNIDAGSLDHYYIRYAWSIRCGLVYIGLEGNGLATPVQAVCGYHHFGFSVQYPAV